MSATDRQNRLLVAEDWKRIYQSFRNADFQSYDFENLRRTMINYIRENYPEDFNDYIESSEYLALIDMIAFLGQSIAFRVDLNARENFLELAERRESILRMARLLGYSAKRNIPGNGLLKFQSVVTTQTVLDSNGRNLAGQTIIWNDPANSNWYEQFIKVINSSLPGSRQFGNPDDKDTVAGVATEQYRFQAINTDVPIYGFTKTVDGRNMNFELVSTVLDNGEIVEEAPAVGNRLAFIHRDDGKGAASNTNGFFLHFRQGSLNQGVFTITQPSTSESIDIDATNINNSDVWLYRLDKNGLETEEWTKVPSLEGNNIIYNSLNKDIRNIFGVITRTGDRVSLIFSDGTFGNLPQGTFRAYYRVSNGLSYSVSPRDMRNVSIDIPYVSNLGQAETLTLTLSLGSTVENASEAESNDNIKSRAPATYYTQNRMVTGEDYNVLPLSASQEIVKIKAVNRTSSGISRFYDLVDPTGKYSRTILFANDGVIYKENYEDLSKFSYVTRTDIEDVVYNQITEILETPNLRSFYYENYTRSLGSNFNLSWYSRTSETNQSTGYVGDTNDATPYKVGTYVGNDLKYIQPGSLIKFTAPFGKYFDKSNNNSLTTGSDTAENAASSLWAKVVSVSGDGTNNGTGILTNGTGPIVLNDIIPSGAILSEVIPKFSTSLNSNVISTIIDLIFSNKPFGLRYDLDNLAWAIVFEANLNTGTGFSLGKQGDNSGQQLDASWLLSFTTDNDFYTVTTRKLRYIFESSEEIRFYFDSSDKIYDSRSSVTIKDKISVLSINNRPDDIIPFTYNREWEISQEYIGLDGYVDRKKIEITFSDTDEDGVVDNPMLFKEIVAPTVSPSTKYIIQERYTLGVGQEDYRYVTNSDNKVLILASESSIGSLLNYTDGQYFYFIDTDVVKKLDQTTSVLEVSLDYKVFVGRDNLKFQYIHNADYNARIDPGLSNIMDIYVLTKRYDISYRQWLIGTVNSEPLPPSTDTLSSVLNPTLSSLKSISDEIIYHPVKYKVLFGDKATLDVQASFKVVKNTEQVVSDNDIKSRTLVAINEFFSIENWEFGDSFFFTELAAYVMNRLAPDIVNFVIVPKKTGLYFGSLYEISSENDQIFISGATVDDIEVITNITASKINTLGAISAVTTATVQQNITSGSY